MKLRKIISLIVGICGIASGILVIIFAVTDSPFPTPLWILFSVSCLANGLLNYANWLKRK